MFVWSFVNNPEYTFNKVFGKNSNLFLSFNPSPAIG